MKRTAPYFAALFLAGGCIAAAPGGNREAQALRAARENARQRNTIVMADFYTDWCGWCKKLDRDVYPAAVVRKEMAGLVFVQVNAEKEAEGDAARLSIDGFPTVVFLSARGKEVGRIVGYFEPMDFAEKIRKIVARSRAAAP